ncbi:MAG: sulfate adenylyltransferase subunit CysN [Akkermansia sp.]
MNINDYLNEHEKKGLLRVLTCGSVDDGKSTLIGRLLYDSKLIFDDQLTALRRASAKNGTAGTGQIDYALLLDGLKAEREQGITIDVAYRFFTTPWRKFIIADCPGHEQYTRNMATGASTADVAIILIDARHGVLTQTRRHSFIVSLLGIRHLIVAVNKMDIFDYDEDVFRRIRAQFAAFAESLDIPDIRYIPISAREGENVTCSMGNTPWYTDAPLLEILETIDVGDRRNIRDFRFPVQYVVRPDLNFRGFAGSIVSGIIRPGDEVMALPSRRTSRVRRIVTADGDLPVAFTPQAVVLELEDEIDISCGEMIVRADNLPTIDERFEAHVIWMDEQPLEEGKSYIVRQAGRNTQGRITKLAYDIDVNTLEHTHPKSLALNHVGRVQIETHTPCFFDAYSRNRSTGAFILIDPVSNATAGAGMILKSHPRRNAVLNTIGEEVPTSFISRAERVQRYGHDGCTVLLAGVSPEAVRRAAGQLEQTLFRRHLHTYSIDATEHPHPENEVELAYALAEAGIICVTALREFPQRAAGELQHLAEPLSLHVWVGSAADSPNSSYFILPPGSDAAHRIQALADLLADPSLAQYNI